MAKRAKFMTAEDVLDELDHDDDFDETMMPGSNDEFSDCNLEDKEDDANYDEQPTPPSQSQQASSCVQHWCVHIFTTCTLIPHFIGFMGISCLADERPVNLIIAIPGYPVCYWRVWGLCSNHQALEGE